MKKLLCFLPAVFLVAALQAQTYIPFPTSNTIWREQFCRTATDPYTTHNYGLTNSDTLINNLTYHKLYLSADTIFQVAEWIGSIREDSFKRVYYRPAGQVTGGSESDKLLYDFSLQLGDTLPANAHNGLNNWMVTMRVTQVDSININGTYHRRITFDWPRTSWVEGVGNNIRGLLYYSGTWPNNGQWNDLICLGREGSWVLHNTNSTAPPFAPLPACNQDLVGIRSHELPLGAITFHPLPLVTTSSVYLTGEGRLHTMEIYDITGRKIKTCTAAANGRVILYRDDYKPGIYLYRLYNDKGQRASGKFVVQ
ncbi:T9SS type A sorting domain-containing protein [Taibaiella chishuiensis]|uniref:Putative secreted protein (Por secretion system target) n=1 Tax=Taibaiella chishuiensis TaxID=1434707 RepID=A0A2P8D5F9_9BACT|nr:T9SS type A sorting domain-containing protein [Taibaiella chishuiensis]PSK92453.1 putative secreted protein (Por secretion system target) [Taibaiella chishuiensis]